MGSYLCEMGKILGIISFRPETPNLKQISCYVLVTSDAYSELGTSRCGCDTLTPWTWWRIHILTHHPHKQGAGLLKYHEMFRYEFLLLICSVHHITELWDFITNTRCGGNVCFTTGIDPYRCNQGYCSSILAVTQPGECRCFSELFLNPLRKRCRVYRWN